MAHQASGFYVTNLISDMSRGDEAALVQKYTKMLRCGVPKEQIEREMSTRGLDTSTMGRIVKQVGTRVVATTNHPRGGGLLGSRSHPSGTSNPV